MNYPRQNLIDALRVAIESQAEAEQQHAIQKHGMPLQKFESAFVAGMKQVKEALERGESLYLTGR